MGSDSGFYVGQVGALIRLDTEDDAGLLAAATKKEIWYKRLTDGVTGAWTAGLSGTKLTYTTTAITDLPKAGEYVLQAYIEGSGWKILGEKVSMIVDEPVKAIS